MNSDDKEDLLLRFCILHPSNLFPLSILNHFCFSFIFANPAGMLDKFDEEVEKNALGAVADTTLAVDNLDGSVPREALGNSVVNIFLF